MSDVGMKNISKEQFLQLFQDHPDMYVCFESERDMTDPIHQMHDFTPSLVATGRSNASPLKFVTHKSMEISWTFVRGNENDASKRLAVYARFEWHPFTLSSSPDQDFIGFHIWTKNAHSLMQHSFGGGERESEKSNGIIVRAEGPVGPLLRATVITRWSS